jgi:hypothetical protein
VSGVQVMDSGVLTLRRHLLFENYLYNLIILIAMRLKIGD